MSQYSNYIYQLENPDEKIFRGNFKRQKEDAPGWVSKNKFFDKMRQEMGEEEYQLRIKEDEAREKEEYYY